MSLTKTSEHKGGEGVLFLEVENLSKSFGGLVAVHDLHFEVKEGEILGLIGPNGSGKTTLFNLIAGFMKPDSGTVKFRGQDITGFKPNRVCEIGITRTFQLAKPFARMSAVQNVMVGKIYGRNPKQTLKKASTESRGILDFVGLGDRWNVLAGNLTLSERKKLELARALAGNPQLLLLDEIMAGLNPVETDSAMQLMKKIRDLGITMIMVEHIVKAVLGISNRVMVVNYGEKIAEGTPHEIITNRRVIEAYLGSEQDA